MTEKNETKKVIIIGAGGVGSWLSHLVVRTLEYKVPGSALLIVDGDSYEKKNAERQAFKTLGNKASVLASEISGTFEKTFIIPVPKWVVGAPPEKQEVKEGETEQPQDYVEADKLINENDIVMVVVDNDAARKLVFDTAAKLDNVDVFSGGNDDRMFGSVYHYRRRNGEDVTTNPTELHDQYANPQDRNPGELSCEERAKLEGGTQTIVANIGVVANIMGRFQTMIIEDQEIADHPHEIYFDLEKGMAQGYDRQPVKIEEPVLTVTT